MARAGSASLRAGVAAALKRAADPACSDCFGEGYYSVSANNSPDRCWDERCPCTEARCDGCGDYLHEHTDRKPCGPEPRVCLDCGHTIDTGSEDDCRCPREDA